MIRMNPERRSHPTNKQIIAKIIDIKSGENQDKYIKNPKEPTQLVSDNVAVTLIDDIQKMLVVDLEHLIREDLYSVGEKLRSYSLNLVDSIAQFYSEKKVSVMIKIEEVSPFESRIVIYNRNRGPIYFLTTYISNLNQKDAPQRIMLRPSYVFHDDSSDLQAVKYSFRQLAVLLLPSLNPNHIQTDLAEEHLFVMRESENKWRDIGGFLHESAIYFRRLCKNLANLKYLPEITKDQFLDNYEDIFQQHSWFIYLCRTNLKIQKNTFKNTIEFYSGDVLLFSLAARSVSYNDKLRMIFCTDIKNIEKKVFEQIIDIRTTTYSMTLLKALDFVQAQNTNSDIIAP